MEMNLDNFEKYGLKEVDIKRAVQMTNNINNWLKQHSTVPTRISNPGSLESEIDKNQNDYEQEL